jgi:O-antigen chain-terminating methyltransferase
MSLQQVVKDIRTRVIRDEMRRRGSAGNHATLEPLEAEVAKLRSAYDRLFDLRNTVGRMPPGPNTLRARIGSVFVRLVQRMLFWYTPQVNRVNDAAIAASAIMCSVVENQLEVHKRLLDSIDALRTEIRTNVTPALVSGPHREDLPARNPCLDHFQLFVQQKLVEGREDGAGVQDRLAALERSGAMDVEGSWISLGSADSDWLSAVKKLGRECLVVTDNTHFQSPDANVVHTDVLSHLSHAPDASFAVITASHLLDRYPFEYSFSVIQQAVRTLKPGGFLVLESPDPANLTVGAHEFWNDPARIPPIPSEVASTLVEYFGLRIIARKHFRPTDPLKRLPFAELSFVDQLNLVLYGPRSYVLFARRDATGGESNR